jgi:hypothetical protein
MVIIHCIIERVSAPCSFYFFITFGRESLKRCNCVALRTYHTVQKSALSTNHLENIRISFCCFFHRFLNNVSSNILRGFKASQYHCERDFSSVQTSVVWSSLEVKSNHQTAQLVDYHVFILWMVWVRFSKLKSPVMTPLLSIALSLSSTRLSFWSKICRVDKMLLNILSN